MLGDDVVSYACLVVSKSRHPRLLPCRWQVYTHEVVSSTSFLTFVLFWTLAYSCIHLF